MSTEARAGKCRDGVEKELKLPKYSSWPNYETALPFVLRRYCGLWGARHLMDPAKKERIGLGPRYVVVSANVPCERSGLRVEAIHA